MSKAPYKQKVFVDCGAPSLHNFLGRTLKKMRAGSLITDRGTDNYDYASAPEYFQYRDAYGAFLKKFSPFITTYSNLDLMNNGEGTYANQKYLEGLGLKPIPVYHVGDDVKWIKKYLDEGYDYIAIGGITPNPTPTILPALDRLFSTLLCDAKGYPRAKYHGFAVTGHKLMVRYPWYSVDSTSWAMMGAYGQMMVPGKAADGSYDYLRKRLTVAVTGRRHGVVSSHYSELSPSKKIYVDNYLASLGMKYGKSTMRYENPDYVPKAAEQICSNTLTEGKHKGKVVVETIIEEGVRNNLSMRTYVNICFFQRLADSLPKWPWPFKMKSHRTLFEV